MGVDHSSRIPVGEHYIRTEFLIQSVLLEIHQEDAVYGTQSITGPYGTLLSHTMPSVSFSTGIFIVSGGGSSVSLPTARHT